MLSVTAIAFIVNAVTQLVKKYLIPTMGLTKTRLIIQASAFLLSVFASLYFLYQDKFPQIKDMLLVGAQLFTYVITFYSVIWSNIPGVIKLLEKSSSKDKDTIE